MKLASTKLQHSLKEHCILKINNTFLIFSLKNILLFCSFFNSHCFRDQHWSCLTVQVSMACWADWFELRGPVSTGYQGAVCVTTYSKKHRCARRVCPDDPRIQNMTVFIWVTAVVRWSFTSITCLAGIICLSSNQLC